MPQYVYEAFDAKGRRKKGHIEAQDAIDARKRLNAKELAIIILADGGQGKRIYKLPSFRAFRSLKLTRFFSDMSMLLEAGVSVDRTLRSLLEAAASATDREAISSVLERVSSGLPLSKALEALMMVSEDVTALTAAGERSGRLPLVMKDIAENLARQETQRKQLLDAAIYPIFLLLMMFAAVGVITFVLVPALEPIFMSSGRSLPLIINLLSSVPSLFSEPAAIFTAIAVSFCLCALSVLQPSLLKKKFVFIALNLPFLGRAMSAYALGRYLQVLALLLKNSVPLTEALALAAKCCPLSSFREKLAGVPDIVVTGRRLPDAFRSTGLFSRGVVSLVEIGDDVNRLPAVLDNGSAILRAESLRLTNHLLSLLTPFLTIFLGVLVGGLVVSVMTAMLSINEMSMP